MRFPLRLAALALLLLASCASVDFQRTTPSSGTFESRALSITLLSIDIPGPALTIARGNAADAGHANLLVEDQFEVPYLGWFDWILDLVGFRYAYIAGTWGHPPGE